MVQSTHHLTIGDQTVLKRYLSWSRGEPSREWRCLELLARLAPGLAPRPLEQQTIDGVPEIVMSRLPGTPLGDEPLTDDQVAAVAAAMRTMQGLPPEHISRLDVRISGLASMVETVGGWAETVDPRDAPAMVVEAYGAGVRWLRGAGPVLTQNPSRAVLANADGNLGNYLWDGSRCRIVDFEDGGLSEVAYEVADLVEHLSASLTGLVDAVALIDSLDLTRAERRRVLECRRLFAIFWLLMLWPGNRAHDRNPPGSWESQATRLLALLGDGAPS
jgi:Ser/Thr protein kinase RdoA (MazF antagonist)